MNFEELSKYGETTRAVYNQVKILEAAVRQTSPSTWENATVSTRRQYRAMVLWQITNRGGAKGVDVEKAYNELRRYRQETQCMFLNQPPHAMPDFEHADPLVLAGLNLQNEFIRHCYDSLDQQMLRVKSATLECLISPQDWDNATTGDTIVSAYVEKLIDLPFSSSAKPLEPGQIHAQWCNRMLKHGWSPGMKTDSVEKTHDMLVPFWRLTEREKRVYENFVK